MQYHSSIELLAAALPEFFAIAASFGQQPSPQTIPGADYRLQLASGVWLTCTGVGKVNGAIVATRVLDAWEAHRSADGPGTTLVVSAGIAGTLPLREESPPSATPGPFARGLLDVILATRSCYADEGVQTPDGFTDCWQMGFPLGHFPADGVPCDPAVLGLLPKLRTAEWATSSGPIATVSTCSGTDALARTVATRTGAIAEAMEGAAIGHAVAVHASPARRPIGLSRRFAELRVISNTTGDRATQIWQIKPALARLGEAARVLVEEYLKQG